VISIRDVSKRYDENVAVDGLSLDIAENNLFGLIGPNGAGKTTTLKMLATLVKPDAGGISIHGLDLPRDVREVRRRIGYMPDTFGTFRGLSCGEYLQFFGCCHGLRGRELSGRIDDVLALTDLTDLRDDPASGLSMGLRQRLSLAKTLIHDPSILLLDEPASGLDPRARIEIRLFLKELARMGKTIIISSHILADLEDICSDIAIIEHGRVVWNGPLDSAREFDAETGELLEIDVPEDDVDRAAALLDGLPDVSDVKRNDSRLELRVHSGNANAILRELLDHDVEVIHFSRKSTRLEDLFLSQTKGIGS
jgi:ABC-2 type transport system ATP-binding protein